MISVPGLVAAGIHPTQARAFAEPLTHACAQFAIDSAVRQAAFLAQCAHESAMFTRLEEGLYYRTPERIRAIFPTSVPSLAVAMTLVNQPQRLANHVYAHKNGNGGIVSGDGWKYRGRGLIQLTGRSNYSDAGVETGRPYLTSPDLLLTPSDAALSAAFFWNSKRLNPLADAWHIDAISKAVNGSWTGAAERRQLSQDFLSALSKGTT